MKDKREEKNKQEKQKVMKAIKNNPYELLEKEGIAKSLLSDVLKEALSIYDATLEQLKDFPSNKNLRDMADEVGKEAISLLRDEIEEMRLAQQTKEEDQQKKQQRKLQSREIAEKTERTIDYLYECRMKLREERRHKLETGEIKPPVKKTLITRLKESLSKIPGLMPKAAKDDKEKIEATEKALRKFLLELKKIWGLNKIKPIQDGIGEKIDKLKESVEKKEEKEAA